MTLLRLDNVTKHYKFRRHWFRPTEWIRAVDGVSFAVGAGEGFGIVGESGCGKSTLAQLIVSLETPSAGEVYFDGQPLTSLQGEARRQLRREIQIVFQDNLAALNPRFTIEETLTEPLRNYQCLLDSRDGQGIRQRLVQALAQVELPAALLNRYPRELSGGQRQRVAIARSLLLEPRFIIFDEATAGLDVTLQERFLRLIQGLRQSLGLTYIFITHNLNYLPAVSDRIGVMYLGKIVEIIAGRDLVNARHPYTQMLLASLPVRHPRRRQNRPLVYGAPPSPANLPPGCRFHPRCPDCRGICRQQEPELITSSNGTAVACHLR